jgi:hypothetical protein
MRKRLHFCFWVAAVLFLFCSTAIGEVDPRQYSVELTTTQAAAPWTPRIDLDWRRDTNATSYSVSRKLPRETDWTPMAILEKKATNFTDTTVWTNVLYEYEVRKETSLGYSGVGYVTSGLRIQPVENRGKLILLVDATVAAPLATELARLRQDLLGDGWTVIQHEISRDTPVPAVKSLIVGEYQADPQNVRCVFLFGHIPVPYSGDYAPDDHENHRGAWPTDAYYGDVDGEWTDSTVFIKKAEKEWNHNVPGDGKFDQSELPSDVELEIGRVDLHNMTCFANKTPSLSEVDLLRQYLEKDHNFRHGKFMTMRRAGLICDNFGEADGEAYAANGWRNFAPFFKPASNDSIPGGSFFSTLASKSYLWSYGAGGGGYYTCAGIGSSDDFAKTDIQTVFAFFFGSYFGDWDNESSFLRAPLGTKSYTLASGWAGRPNWFLHPMAMGETIGYSTRLTQNNSTNGVYQMAGEAARGVHTALLGDPTLRLHPVMPPGNLNCSQADKGITITWTSPSETNLQGFFVYRATSPEGPFTRISGGLPIQQSTFTDTNGTPDHTYVVKTVKFEITPAGSYYNLSQGKFGSVNSAPAAPSALVATPGENSIALTWTDNSGNETEFAIYRRAANETIFAKIGAVAADVATFQDTVAPGLAYIYKVRAASSVGQSAFSNEATSQAAIAALATFVGIDTTTSGTWKGAYGEEGFNVIGDVAAYPAYVGVTVTGNQSWVWDWSTTDAAALQRPADNSRLASCWYSSAAFDVQLSFKDTAAHRVSFYFLDWDQANRTAQVDVLDANTGASLSTRTISDFANGVYLTWDFQGKVRVRVTPTQANAVLSGIFFDSPSPRAQAPAISPGTGTYFDAVEVALNAENGAEIRYTLDGTDPQSTSTLYSGTFTVTNTATLKARAYKTGLRDSLVASAAYKIVSSASASASVEFVGSNDTIGGSWKGAYGAEGFVLIADATLLPSYAQINVSGAEQWIWEYSTSDPRAVERNNESSRMAPCWYSSTAFDVDVTISDATPHMVTFYCLDWDFGGRAQLIEVIDYDTGRVLDTREVTNFTSGVYLSYRVQGRVIVRFTCTQSYNAVLSGIFIDPAE